MSFGDRLRAARKEAGLSQTELAGDRCSVSYVSHLESGRRTPTAEILRYFETTLELEPGALGDSSDMSQSGRRKAGEAEAVALYAEAVHSWRHSSFGLAYEQAREARAGLPSVSRSDLTLLISALLVEINIDLGHYAEALEEALAHLAVARAAGSPLLEVRAGVLASNAARLDAKLAQAASLGHDAAQLAASAELPATVRVPALIAAIAARHPESESLTAELETVVEGMVPSHTKGLAEWALGTMAMRAGRIEEGMELHRRVNDNLSPTADFRNWARFPRAVAEERLDAGTDEGVRTLLDEALMRLQLLNNPDELASLAIVQARFARTQERFDDALAFIDDALSDADLPVLTQARLHLAKAEIHVAQGDSADATAVALKAARAFTDAGDVDRAQSAWALIDTVSGAGE